MLSVYIRRKGVGLTVRTLLERTVHINPPMLCLTHILTAFVFLENLKLLNVGHLGPEGDNGVAVTFITKMIHTVAAFIQNYSTTCQRKNMLVENK